jgi:hypothetical protein
MDWGPVIHDIQWWSGWSWSGWVAIGSIGTVGALVVALSLGLWASGLSGWFYKPRLTVALKPGFADFCPVDATTTVQHGNQVLIQKVSDQYWCRFRVVNSGSRSTVSATNVEVLLSRLWALDKKQALEVQPFLPLRLAWADIVTSPFQPESEVVAPLVQPGVFRYCNLCMVDSTRTQWLEFAGRPIPNQMQGQWPTRKPVGLYEVDVVLTAANFPARFVTFRIDFKGGAWPAPGGSLDAMYTAELVYQGKRAPKHPIAVKA